MPIQKITETETSSSPSPDTHFLVTQPETDEAGKIIESLRRIGADDIANMFKAKFGLGDTAKEIASLKEDVMEINSSSLTNGNYDENGNRINDMQKYCSVIYKVKKPRVLLISEDENVKVSFHCWSSSWNYLGTKDVNSQPSSATLLEGTEYAAVVTDKTAINFHFMSFDDEQAKNDFVISDFYNNEYINSKGLLTYSQYYNRSKIAYRIEPEKFYRCDSNVTTNLACFDEFLNYLGSVEIFSKNVKSGKRTPKNSAYAFLYYRNSQASTEIRLTLISSASFDVMTIPSVNSREYILYENTTMLDTGAFTDSETSDLIVLTEPKMFSILATAESDVANCIYYTETDQNAPNKCNLLRYKNGGIAYFIPDNAIKLCLNLKKGEKAFALGKEFYTESSNDIFDIFSVKESVTHNGIKYEWINGKTECTMKGTSTGVSVNYLYNDSSKLPFNLNPKDNVFIDFIKTCNVSIHFAFYLNDGQTRYVMVDKPSYMLKIPENAVGCYIRLRIASGETINGKISSISMRKHMSDIGLYNFSYPQNMPLLVSFVDDDAVNDTFVDRYYQACKHNGVYGAYAVQTYLLPTLNVDNMLKYELEGFGMLTHCRKQGNEYRLLNEGDYEYCLKDLGTAIRTMKDAGFITFNHFVIPYGTKDERVRSLARTFGMESAMSTADEDFNKHYDDDEYYIKRVALEAKQTGEKSVDEVKDYIDKMVSEGQGWLIITTHFCDNWSTSGNRWTDKVWNETLDSKGYQIGYDLFNQVCDYAKQKGCKFVSYTEGIKLFKKGLR